MAWETFKIQPDEQLLAQFAAAVTGANVHESNRLRSNYMGWCQLGHEQAAERAAKAMRIAIAERRI